MRCAALPLPQSLPMRRQIASWRRRSAASPLLSDADRLEKLRTGCAIAKGEYSVHNTVKRFADGIIEALSAA